MRCRCLSYGSCALIRHGWGLVRLVWTFATSLCGSSNIERRQMMADYVLETQPLTDKDMAALEATMPAKAVTRNGSMEKQLAAWKAKAEAYVANHVLRSSLIAGAAGAALMWNVQRALRSPLPRKSRNGNAVTTRRRWKSRRAAVGLEGFSR